MFDTTLSRIARGAPYLAAADERDLLIKAQAGDAAARDRIVLAHLRLVMTAAYKLRNYGVPFDDLAHEGVVGLTEALDKFDASQPVRFATYATWWVKARMHDTALRGASAVRMGHSANQKRLFYGLRAARARLERAGTMTASEVRAELARIFAVDEPAVDMMSVRLTAGDLSLNETVGEGETERGDLLADDGPTPDVLVERDLDGDRRRGAIEAAIARLNEREQIVIRARSYAEDDAVISLEDIGNRFGVTRERVRQIEARALEKLGKFLTPNTASRGLALQ